MKKIKTSDHSVKSEPNSVNLSTSSKPRLMIHFLLNLVNDSFLATSLNNNMHFGKPLKKLKKNKTGIDNPNQVHGNNRVKQSTYKLQAKERN